MADYYKYHREVISKKRRKRALIALLAVLVLLCAAAGLYWNQVTRREAVEAGAEQPAPAVELVAAVPTAEPTPAPTEVPGSYLPARLLPQVDTAAWNTSAAAEQTIDTEYLNTDARMAGLPALGQVSSSYFDTITFLGDSITEGLEAYDSGVGGATVLGYRGAGPNSVVNNAACHDYTRGVDEIPLDAVAASAPDYVYLMFGTNSLVTQGNEESFIAYYERMIDMLRERLDPGVIYYVQAILPVQEYVRDRQPGLDNDRIRTVNNLLANMALRKGCYFVNVAEVLTNAEGSQIDDYDADGIHMQPGGYRAWTQYVATHTAWNRRTLYQGDNPWYILGT